MNNPEYVKIGDKKYKINTDFRIAIECDRIANSDDIKDYERSLAIIYLLFGEEGLKDFENHVQLLELAKKYLACGKEIEDNEDRDMDFIEDMDYIEASFMSDYRIDLSNIKMHWWTFYKLINGLSNSELGNCCILNRIRNLRNFDVSQIKSAKERSKILKAKKMVALKRKNSITKEHLESARKFYEQMGYGKEER